MTATRGSRVVIDRLNAVYRIPRDHPGRNASRLRLDALMRNRLPYTCEQIVDRLLDPGDRSVWVVRRVTATVALDLARPDEELATVWAHGIGHAIARSLVNGSAADVARFENDDSFVVAFLSDLLAGRARSAWYYAPFAQLRSLPLDVALSETLIRRRGKIAVILERLARAGKLDELVSGLGEPEARVILVELSRELDATATPERALLDRLAESVRRQGVRGRPAGTAVNALKLVGAVLSAPSATWARRGLVRGAEAVLAAVDLAAGSSHAREIALAIAPPPHAHGLAATRAGGAVSDALGPLAAAAAGDSAWLERILSAVTLDAAAATGVSSESTVLPAAFATELGGIFLLLPNLEQLPEALWEDPALRYLLARKCLGVASDNEGAADAGLLLACGLKRKPRDDALAGRDAAADAAAMLEFFLDDPSGEWLAAAQPEQLHRPTLYDRVAADLAYFAGGAPDERAERAWALAARAVLTTFARRFPGFERSSAQFLRQNLLTGTSIVRALPDRIVVELPDVPLGIVLRLAGFDGLDLSPPWGDGRRLTLFLPGTAVGSEV